MGFIADAAVDLGLSSSMNAARAARFSLRGSSETGRCTSPSACVGLTSRKGLLPGDNFGVQ